ncbi:MAG TPA: amidohydrolase family protein [Woeseiaceae bacterium]|nr:amidohydrolase family protein [Woeseiaceae bacterium]
MYRRTLPSIITLLPALALAGQPVIDVHLHALPYTHQGPPPVAMCTPLEMPVWDQRVPYAETFMTLLKEPACDDPIWSPTSDEELLQRTLDELERHNVYGILSGPPEFVARWADAAPNRFLRGLLFAPGENAPSPEEVIELHEAGQLDILAEITTQYAGMAPDDEWLMPYWAALEAHDIPAGIHVGPGPPGLLYLGAQGYRARLHSALTLEEVLARHPRLRLFIGHAGFPLLDDLLALMYAHPQVYVGIGVIVFTQPREAFYRYLRGIVDAGFGKRILFGSDQMVWPETIGRSIRVIEDAPFLSDEQKRDILFNNAVSFLRLSESDIARMLEESN